MEMLLSRTAIRVAFAVIGFAGIVPLSTAWADGLQTGRRLSAEMAIHAVREAVMHCATQR